MFIPATLPGVCRAINSKQGDCTRPNIGNFMARAVARPAVQEAMKAEGLLK
jgi:hypothetical protein